MPKLSLWNIKKNNDFKFFDRTISETFRRGGTAFFAYKYLGTYNQGTGDATQPDYDADDPTNIQDILFLENRDRKYDTNVYEMRGIYTVQDNDFDLSQFGLFLSSDVLYVSFHLNDMIDIMGRKLMAGDVLEVAHLKDDTLLSTDPNQDFGPVIPKLYVIDDANRSAEGFSATWWPHIWRVKMKPLTDSQEYQDILNQTTFNDGDNTTDPNGDGTTLGDIVSTGSIEIAISNALLEEAENEVPTRNLTNQHLYVLPDHPQSGLPYLFMTDGVPPNGAEIAGFGDQFPIDAPDGTWFMRDDYVPSVLYQKQKNRWVRMEFDWTESWKPANRTLAQFINNRKKILTSQGLIDSKVPISKAITSREKLPKPDK